MLVFVTLQTIVIISGSPGQNFRVDEANDAEIIEAAKPLPGVNNLKEKRIPQVMVWLYGGHLNGLVKDEVNQRGRYTSQLKNLQEKAMPLSALMKSYNDEQSKQ